MGKRTTYRNEMERLRKGIVFAWIINFVILALTFEAVFVFVMLKESSSNSDIVMFLIMTSILSAIVSAVVVGLVMRFSSKVMLTAAGPELSKVESGPLFNVVEEIAIASGRGNNVPEVYVAKTDGVANAYAISDSKGNSRIVVTEQLLKMLNREELQGVIAHEMGHIVSGDSEAMTKLVALTSTVGIISGVATRMFRGGGNNEKSNPVAVVLIALSFVFLLVAPILSRLANAYMSRTRESQADASSVKFTRDPTALAKALMKLEASDDGKDGSEDEKKFNSKVGELAFYAPKLHANRLATHPPTSERIQKLREMGAQV